MKTTMERAPITSADLVVITFTSRNQDALQRYACAAPGEQTEWFFSSDARDLYASTLAARLGVKVRAGR